MTSPINVIVDSIPNATWLNYAAIFALPIALLIASFIFTHFTNKKSSKEKLKDDVYYAVDTVFRAVSAFNQLKNKIKMHQDNNPDVIISNNPALSRSTSESQKMQHDLRMWHYQHEVKQRSQLGESLIDIVSVQTRVQFLLGEETTQALDSVVKEIRDYSKKFDTISDELMTKCVDEINELNKIVSTNPEKWLK